MSSELNPYDIKGHDGIKLDGLPIKGKNHQPDEFGHEYVRFGDTRKVFDHKKSAEDIQILIAEYNEYGYNNRVPKLADFELRKAVAKFRASLDAWELIPCKKVFSKDECYIRCLLEGPGFATFLKKSRATTLRGLTSITETELEDEYFHPEGYEGYDSILHERNLIHWSEKEGLDDVKYAFMPASNDAHDFPELMDKFLRGLKIDREEFMIELDTLGTLKNTRMYDVKTGKTSLMRDFWTDEIDLDQPYFAKRAIVEIEPGNTRDTGVGDSSTIAKIKIITAICKVILKHCSHSANTDAETSTRRLARILQRNGYLHVDFKKYGLAFPRILQNIALVKIGMEFEIDIEQLLVNDFFIDIDGKTYRTSRGIVLGWLDCLNEICVHAILSGIKDDGVNFDWIQFNDDIEVSFFSREDIAGEKAEYLREIILSTFHTYDILISISKTYGSLSSVFLEKYFRFEENYNLDMTKRQLACRPYAKSLVSSEPWQAKMNFAAAYAYWPNEELATRCISTCRIEFLETEQVASLVCGGWYPSDASDLNRSLEGQDSRLLSLACELMKVSLPELSTRPMRVSTAEQIRVAKDNKVCLSKEPQQGRELFDMKETIFDVNFEIENIFVTYASRRKQSSASLHELDNAQRILMEKLSRRMVKTDYG